MAFGIATLRHRQHVRAGQAFGEPLSLRGRSVMRFGKDAAINGFVVHHPSISKQHAVVQFRRGKTQRVEPWLMDLESVNKTYLHVADAVRAPPCGCLACASLCSTCAAPVPTRWT